MQRDAQRDRLWIPLPSIRALTTLAVLSLVASLPLAAAAGETEAVERRLLDVVSFLASEQCQGRATGTEGIDLAAEFIRERFEEIGLNTQLVDGTPFQPFEVDDRPKVGPETELRFSAPDADGGPGTSFELTPEVDFRPLGGTGCEAFDLPLVFAGYGITGKKEGYDDFADVDVEGKAVIVLRHEPEQANAESVFNGDKDSGHASLRSKLANARAHGAACIIFCTDEFEVRKSLGQLWEDWNKTLGELAAENAKLASPDGLSLQQIAEGKAAMGALVDRLAELRRELDGRFDPLLPFGSASLRGDDAAIPVVQCRRDAVDRLLAAAGAQDLAALEKEIDNGPKPASFELTGWRAAGRVDVRRDKLPARNVVALLEGKGPMADEAVIVGAHYDHVGARTNGAGEMEIYNGADDNASGVAAMIEIARTLAAADEPPPRDVLFIAFSAEERGLLGSRHYVEHPLVPLADTVTMVNLDMVGRLRSDNLTIFGTSTATNFDGLVDRLAEEHGMTLTKRPSGTGPSDHASFYRKEIPVLFFITGTHADLHKPTDDVEKINAAGMRRVTAMVTDAVEEILASEARPPFQQVDNKPAPQRGYLGVMPEAATSGPGVVLRQVLAGGPAEKAGLKTGDLILKVGDAELRSVAELVGTVGRHKPGDKIRLTVRQGGEERVLEVTLGKR